MKKSILALALICLSFFAEAQTENKESSHYKAAVEYTAALEMEKNTTESIDQMIDMQLKNNPSLASKREAFKKFMLKHMSWSVLREDYLKIYMSEFTEAELKDMTAFYRTPTGKKVAAKQNAITLKTAQLGQDKMQANMAELMEMLQ